MSELFGNCIVLNYIAQQAILIIWSRISFQSLQIIKKNWIAGIQWNLVNPDANNPDALLSGRMLNETNS